MAACSVSTGAVARNAFYRERAEAGARDLDGASGWQGRDAPLPLPMRDFRERERVRNLDRFATSVHPHP